MSSARVSSRRHDLIVCGGGPGGIHAAISAARLGIKVLLVERYGFLGGMNTAGLVGPIMTFHAGSLQIVRGIADELISKLQTLGGTPGHLTDPIWANTSLTPVDTELYKIVLIEETLKSGVELLLHTSVIGAERDGRRVRAIEVSNKKGISRYEAAHFIDATGDGDLAAAMGCSFTHGRRSDRRTQPMSLMFKMAGVNVSLIRDAIARDPANFYLGFPLEKYLSLPALAVSGFYKEVTAGKKEGKFPCERDRVLFFGLPREGEVTVNTLRIADVSGINPEDLTRAEVALRIQTPALVKFLNDFIPGFSGAHLTETAAQVGVRETRHIEGLYTLTAEDIIAQRPFEDVIAHASYPIDIHSPDGSGMKIVDPRKDRPESYYDIPLRCLLPANFDNLIVTGRCISAEHEASASARISATCMALGEASGVVAAHLVRDGKSSVAEISVTEVQKQLSRQGAFLRGA